MIALSDTILARTAILSLMSATRSRSGEVMMDEVSRSTRTLSESILRSSSAWDGGKMPVRSRSDSSAI